MPPRPQLTVRSLFLAVAVCCLTFTIAAVGNTSVMLITTLLALFSPSGGWLLTRLLPTQYQLPIYLTALSFSAAVLICCFWIGDGTLALPSSVVFLTIWVPQLCWIFFFEFCEYEQANAQEQEENPS